MPTGFNWENTLSMTLNCFTLREMYTFPWIISSLRERCAKLDEDWDSPVHKRACFPDLHTLHFHDLEANIHQNRPFARYYDQNPFSFSFQLYLNLVIPARLTSNLHKKAHPWRYGLMLQRKKNVILQNLEAHVAILVLVCESSVHYDFIL